MTNAKVAANSARIANAPLPSDKAGFPKASAKLVIFGEFFCTHASTWYLRTR